MENSDSSDSNSSIDLGSGIPPDSSGKNPTSRWKWLLLLGVLSCIGVCSWVGYLYFYKPGGKSLQNYRPPVCREVFNAEGKVIQYKCPFNGVRIWKPLREIDPKLKKLVVFLEDAKFYSHSGFDVDELVHSLEENIEKKKFARGGSTITQQLAKNLFLTKEKSLFRKASEVPLSMRLEEELSKSQILELYLNTIEWGPGIYGAEAASRLYFDHSASEMNDSEVWLLALMIPNPKELCLWTRPRAKKSILHRASQLSRRLWGDKVFSRSEAQEKLQNFQAFLDEWSKKRPDAAAQETRTFPMAWSPK